MSVACASPLELAELVDYWFGDEDPDRREAVEEHLMGCDACGHRLRGVLELGEGVRRLARAGTFEVVVTPAFLERAAAQGLRTREYRVPPGGRVACTVTPEDDLLVSRLQGDFRGVTRLDVVTRMEGQPDRYSEDVPFRADASELILAQAMPALRALGRSLLRVSLVSRDVAGERLLGEYDFDHTPTPG